MNWEAIGAVAELSAAIGVIASLLYVATQVRYSNRASSIQAKLENTRFLTEFNDLLLQNRELDRVLVKGQQDFSSLTSEESRVFIQLGVKAFWYFSAAHFQYRARTITESDWHEILFVIDVWLRSPGGLSWWHAVGKHLFGSEFGCFIDEHLTTLYPDKANAR